jgi:hypothetical protein
LESMRTPFRARAAPPAQATTSLTVRMAGDTAWLEEEEEEELAAAAVAVTTADAGLVAEAVTAEAQGAGAGAVGSRQAFMSNPMQFPVC